MSTSSRERAALADLLARLGPDAPTCCAGWTTAHLAAHLVVRDRRPDALPGYGLEFAGVAGPVPAWSHRLEDRLRTSTPYAAVVDRLRAGPPVWSPMGLPVLGDLVNATEFLIHHEDVRRAQPGWSPLARPLAVQEDVWRSLRFLARAAAKRMRRTLVLRRSDATNAERRFAGGPATTTLTGEPVELLLWLSGRRDVARVAVS